MTITNDIAAISKMSSEDQYEVRVQQLQADGLTRSDAQAAADYEVMIDALLVNIQKSIEQHKPVEEMNEHDIQELAEEALNAACLAIQIRLGVTCGGLASIFFSDGIVKEKFANYINTEIEQIKDQTVTT